MKKGCCIGCGAVLLVFLLLAGYFMYMLFGGTVKLSDDISYYQALTGESDGSQSIPLLGQDTDIYCPYDLPKVSELEPYENLRFAYQAHRMSVFQSNSYILLLSYDAEAYEARKQAFEEVYTWRTELILGDTEDVSPDFELDGFAFRCVEGGYYPKEMFCIGTRDEAREIAIIYFYDQDLDYIAPDMSDFLLEETCWSKVVGR